MFQSQALFHVMLQLYKTFQGDKRRYLIYKEYPCSVEQLKDQPNLNYSNKKLSGFLSNQPHVWSAVFSYLPEREDATAEDLKQQKNIITSRSFFFIRPFTWLRTCSNSSFNWNAKVRSEWFAKSGFVGLISIQRLDSNPGWLGVE